MLAQTQLMQIVETLLTSTKDSETNLSFFQVIQENNSTVQYLVIGNANFRDGRTTHASKVPTGSSKFFYYEGGYARVSVTNEQMTVFFYGADEKLLYQIESKPRRKEILV